MKIKLVTANDSTKLSKLNPAAVAGFKGSEEAGRALAAQLNDRLELLQQVLAAEHKHKILVVLQAMDTGGKDGAIRKVLSGINPQGVKVVSFKSPTANELDHDYLWRVHQHTPAKGELVVFNRSHYEDVLITRVHGWIDKKTCERRYQQINDFERMLTEEGTTIIKFFLMISKDEQKARLQARLYTPEKRWKFNIGDLDERKHWDNYMAAYQSALRATSTKSARWHIVPADNKWVRDLYLLSVIVDALERLKMRYPTEQPGLDQLVVE